MNRSYCYILLTIIVQELLPNGKNHNNIGKNNGRKSVKKPELEFLLLSNRGSGKEAANCATSRTQNPKTNTGGDRRTCSRRPGSDCEDRVDVLLSTSGVLERLGFGLRD